jgi:hypothetical protein
MKEPPAPGFDPAIAGGAGKEGLIVVLRFMEEAAARDRAVARSGEKYQR